MVVKIECRDGARIVALRASLALMHWLRRAMPPTRLPSLAPFEMHAAKWPTPNEGDPLMMTLVYAAIERRWNKSPPFAVAPPDPDAAFGGDLYQNDCLAVLHWLHAEGDPVGLRISEEP